MHAACPTNCLPLNIIAATIIG